MASTLYNIARSGYLTDVTVGAFTGQLDWVSDNIKAVLVHVGDPGAGWYQFDATHTSLSDVPVASRVATTDLQGNALDIGLEGWAEADNTTFTNVSGPEVSAVILYRDHGSGDTDDDVLIGYFEDVVSGLPITPNGGDISILWNAGSNKRLFRL